ncbi:phenylacetyl-CoA ligase [Xylaria telfairii]|nr:phenylacetyl-CoA ligase [Xylaria telfairii]
MPFQSPYSSVQIPKTDVASLIWSAFTPADASRVLLASEDGAQKYSAATLKETALGFSCGLVNQLGFARGQVLLLFCANSIHVLPVILGTLQVGGIVSPANPAYGVDELSHQLHDSGGSVIVTQQPFLAIVMNVARKIGINHDRIILLPDLLQPVSLFSPLSTIVPFSDLVACSTTESAKYNIDSHNDIAFLVYTSGTTGLPKGAELSHHNIVSNILMYSAAIPIFPTDVVLAFLPLFHIYGLTIMALQSLYQLARVIVMANFNLERFYKTIQLHQVSVAYIVPPVAAMLLRPNTPKLRDISPIRLMISGGAPLGLKLIQSIYAYHDIKLLQGYGLTETSPATFMVSLSQFPIANGSVGCLLPNQEAKLLDIDNSAVETTRGGRPGEICVRGPNIFKGYRNNPLATKASFTNDGFFKTGDVGILDDGGYLWVVDRIKELIKYKGFQVAPAELEAILLEHEGVSDACVVPVYDKKLTTEVPRAYVVRTLGWQPTNRHARSLEQAAALELQDWVETRVAHYKRLRGGVHFVPELPRTASGKILRRQLKETANKSRL